MQRTGVIPNSVAPRSGRKAGIAAHVPVCRASTVAAGYNAPSPAFAGGMLLAGTSAHVAPPFSVATITKRPFTGSLMAFGKLQDLLPTRPMVYKGQNFINFGILILLALLFGSFHAHVVKVYCKFVLKIFCCLYFL